MNTFLAVLVGAIIGSLSKSFLENLLPDSIREYFKAKRNLGFYFIRLYRESSKLHNDLIWHRNNARKGTADQQTPYYYLNLAYSFYRFQAIRKIIDETMEENFIRLPKRYLLFESMKNILNRATVSNYYFDFEGENFTYSSFNTISKIRYEKVISQMIVKETDHTKPEIIDVYCFEQMLKEKPDIQSKVDRLLGFFKNMTNESIAYKRIHLMIASLRLLNANIAINKPRKKLIREYAEIPINSKKLILNLRQIVSEETLTSFSQDIEKQKRIRFDKEYVYTI